MTSIPLFWAGIMALACCSLLFIAIHFKLNRTKIILVSLVLLVGQFTLYSYWGNSDELTHVRAYQTISMKLDEIGQNKDLNLEQALVELDELSKTIGYSHKGIARMGGIYSELGRFKESVAMLEQAMALSPTTSEYAIQWIYHQSFLHQGKLPLEARKRAESLLNDPKAKDAAMNMLAMDDYFQGKYESAIAHWEDILQNDKTLTPERRLILEKAMANAEAKMIRSREQGTHTKLSDSGG